jgi:hypothetical protein
VPVLADGKCGTPILNGQLHNHCVPTKQRLDSEVVQKCKSLLSHHVPVGKIHMDIVTSGEELTESNSPTKKQLSNMKYYMKRQYFPSGNHFTILINGVKEMPFKIS